MGYANFITKSIWGRQLGLQQMSTSVTGSGITGANPTFIVGAEAVRQETTTTDTTATNLKAWGTSWLQGTSAASSAVYTLDPPIPGVTKTIMGSTGNGPVYAKTANGEVIQTTAGSTFNTIKISSSGGGFQLIGITTGIWFAPALTSGTSSQASGFTLTTST